MKLKANISATIVILYLSFIVFCACAVDAGYVITTRYRMQRLTETIALYAASTLKSLPLENRNELALEPIKESFEQLYSPEVSGYYSFEISDIEIRGEETSTPKVKISTQANIPTIFLRFAGIGFVRVLQTSYALSEEKNIAPEETALHSWLFTIPEYITDKEGYDFKINFDKEYFVYAGIGTRSGAKHWMDMGQKSDGEPVEIALDSVNLYKLEGERNFNIAIEPSLGLVKYVKVYDATATSGSESPSEESPEEEESEEIELPVIGFLKDVFGLKAYAEEDEPTAEEPSGSEETGEETDETGDRDEETEPTESSANVPRLTVLNSAKLIRKVQFEEEDEEEEE